MLRRAIPTSLGLLFLCWPVVLRAQGYGRDIASPYGVSPAMPDTGGGAAYLPYGMNSGGFIPYSSGPGGGLGVQPRMMPTSPGAAESGMTSMPGLRAPVIGRVRGELTPLTPIRRSGLGMGGAMGAGSMLRPASPLGRMDTMSRPPVGSYPFRQPPSLIGPATSAPAMSM